MEKGQSQPNKKQSLFSFEKNIDCSEFSFDKIIKKIAT